MIRHLVARLQDRAARVFGLEPIQRAPLVLAMLHRPPGDAAGYWLQLVIAVVLATLGLALDSTAVVIGAMLIAPLMRPIVELAMGLATGSTPLLFRTALRAISSIVIAVAASAAFTSLLPFHEVTRELLARTAPSLLDLFVAAACALAGAYAVVIASNDVATTAAGTSIGISLVPPLCTAGYGIAIGDQDMAVGAALLFTANVTGIITVASLLFVVVGFGQVNIREAEQTLDADANIGVATRVGRALSSRRSERVGTLIRVLAPLALLAAVAFPLERAVGEMSRRSAIRNRVTELLANGKQERVVSYALDQTARPVVLRVVIVGDPPRARALEATLRNELSAVGARRAAVSVWAVSDATTISALSARIEDIPIPVPTPPLPPPVPLGDRVRASWPAGAGALLDVWISEGDPVRVRVRHLGAPLGDAALQLLAQLVDHDRRPVIEDDALDVIEADPANGAAWYADATRLVAAARALPQLRVCLTVPAPTRRDRRDSATVAIRAQLDAAIRDMPNVEIATGDRWRAVPRLASCDEP
ncbi:MAG TPA: DUF389 domain-containing protein [Kofleriaceae bacterium]|nr:DUF389 domain-containing protein [Kofleriaceae bacterium]